MSEFLHLNNMSADQKKMIDDGQALVNDAKEKMKDRKYNLDLTSKLLLKSECREIDKIIKLIFNGKAKEKDIKHLEILIVQLRTNLDGITGFYG